MRFLGEYGEDILVMNLNLRGIPRATLLHHHYVLNIA